MKTVLIHLLRDDKSDFSLMRQTPKSEGVWKGYLFYINEAPCECDYLVVFAGHRGVIRMELAKKNSLFIAREPPSIKKYSEEYLAQFGSVICSDSELNHPHLIQTQQGHPWFCGRRILPGDQSRMVKFYNDYKAETSIEKPKLLSVVCSAKQKNQGHRKRFEFVKCLKDEFGNDLDLFGYGQNQVVDKAEAIRSYRYHIAIENSSYPDYWTEKLSDCYLEGAFPFYAGCPNVDQYFPEDSYQVIDLDDPEGTVQMIRRMIDENVYQRALPALGEAKRRVLDDYNLFNVIAEHFDTVESRQREPCEAFKAYPSRWFRKGPLYRALWGVGERFKLIKH